MADEKFAKQLSLGIEDSGLTKKEIAEKTYMSASAVGKYALGERDADHDKKKSLLRIIKSVRLRYSAARSDFHVISYMQKGRIKQDVFAAERQADREERERKAVWDAFNDACTVLKHDRTRVEAEHIDRGFKEFAEEIGAEITEFLALADYAEVDPQKYIDEFNKKLGG